jgi:hypothetical protein
MARIRRPAREGLALAIFMLPESCLGLGLERPRPGSGGLVVEQSRARKSEAGNARAAPIRRICRRPNRRNAGRRSRST